MSVEQSVPSTGVKAWSPDQEKLMIWLTTPTAAREPRSQRALAAQLEVDEATLSRWKRLPGFGAAVARLSAAVIGCELADVLRAQVKAAKGGSLPHAQWLFAIAGVPNAQAALESTASSARMVIEIVDDRPAAH